MKYARAQQEFSRKLEQSVSKGCILVLAQIYILIFSASCTDVLSLNYSKKMISCSWMSHKTLVDFRSSANIISIKLYIVSYTSTPTLLWLLLLHFLLSFIASSSLSSCLTRFQHLQGSSSWSPAELAFPPSYALYTAAFDLGAPCSTLVNKDFHVPVCSPTVQQYTCRSHIWNSDSTGFQHASMGMEEKQLLCPSCRRGHQEIMSECAASQTK